MMEKVIIFGASNLGKIAYNVLKEKYDICFFTDNNKNKWEKEFCGLKIIAPYDLLKYKAAKIIIASMYYDEISIQLKKMELYNIFIFNYSDPNDKTYEKKFFLDRMCNTDIYKNIIIDENFKKKFLYNFSYIYKLDTNNNRLFFNNNRKKILIISYIFPPLSGSGTQRTLKYVKYLKKFNYEPIVITVDNGFYDFPKDESFLKEIDNNIKIIRIKEKYYSTEQLNEEAIQQIFNLIYGLIDDKNLINNFKKHIKEKDCIHRKELLCPERYIIWANEVLKNIEEFIDFTKIDLIYSSSGPYSNHIIGFYLNKKFNKPWVTDFRDEWTNNPHHRYNVNSIKYKMHFNMEKKIVNACNKLITVTPISSNNYKKIFRLNNNKVHTITNGYDEDDFANIDTESQKVNYIFEIIYNGLICSGREPYTFIKALNELIDEGKINCKKIKIYFLGKIDNDILSEIERLDIYDIVNIQGYKSHRESLKYILNADLLLLIVGKGEKFKSVYTGKVFEYLRTYNSIISLAPKNGVVCDLLKDTNCGINCEMDNMEDIKKTVFLYYLKWEKGIKPDKVNISEIKKYDRRNLTGKLAKIFDDLLVK